ncbi:aldose 1-epimerase family protein [uncultured Tateyamaria sp.]|uniref:aldose 1-epimerase family protein n=1 Tax=Tateyamaria sp. 1078 TaxID=3417464 RepID=UPI002630EF32|nr:aldose 1-epimerase family protein [uncultured Tateyamaria sp.]
MRLYGQDLTRREVAALSGDLSQFAGVRQMVLSDGAEAGQRALEFRTGTGLRFTLMVDRCLDIGSCDYNGMAIGWNSSAGFRNPALHEAEGEGGLGFMRSFSGLVMTCGLDHILGGYEAEVPEYNYPGRPTASYGIHGRIGMLPARLTGYGERWEGDRCFLWAEGCVRQAAVFAEDLELIRRVEVEVGTNDIALSDEVRNRGFNRTPHMLCYHINIGHPVLADGARYVAPIEDVVWAAHADSYKDQGVGYARPSGPADTFREQVWQHEMKADAAGNVAVALINDALPLGLEVTTYKAELPCAYEWQHLQSGGYAFGIEPSTHHVLGNGFARERGEMIWLDHGDSRHYRVGFKVLTNADEIQRSEAAITATQPQPADPFPVPSGDFRAIPGRG